MRRCPAAAIVRRARPVLLTAVAAILGLVPLAFSVFWGLMAIAIMGGLLSATLLTLCFLPALYAAWTRVEQTTIATPQQRSFEVGASVVT